MAGPRPRRRPGRRREGAFNPAGAASKADAAAKALEARYGAAALPAARPDPIETLVETILSQNTNDRNRDAAFRSLKAAFPAWEDAAAASAASIGRAIRSAGLWRRKAACIRRSLLWARRTFGTCTLAPLRGMETGEAAQLLLGIKGVGLKTVHVVLAMNLGRDVFPVDTHCLRLLVRIGVLPAGTTADKAHSLMRVLSPPGRSLPFHLNLIRHGREVCRARSPRCAGCVLAGMCRADAARRQGRA